MNQNSDLIFSKKLTKIFIATFWIQMTTNKVFFTIHIFGKITFLTEFYLLFEHCGIWVVV